MYTPIFYDESPARTRDFCFCDTDILNTVLLTYAPAMILHAGNDERLTGSALVVLLKRHYPQQWGFVAFTFSGIMFTYANKSKIEYCHSEPSYGFAYNLPLACVDTI